MASQAITGLALSPAQYQALQVPVLQIPSPTELFNFQVALFDRMEIRIVTQDIENLRSQIPTDPSFFLFIPPVPRLADIPALLRRISKLEEGAQGHLDPSPSVLEGLKSEEEIPQESHLIIKCNDGTGALHKNAQARSNWFRSQSKTPYTFWQAMVHVMVYPAILKTHQLMAVGTVSGQKLLDKKMSPVLSTSAGPLQLSMRCWDDPVVNCAMPCYEMIRTLPKKRQ